MIDRLYTPQSCAHPAYQLDWSLSVFWRSCPDHTGAWLTQLQEHVARDGIRILQHQFQPPDVSKFLISTTPEIAPIQVVQRVKGRLAWMLGQKSALPRDALAKGRSRFNSVHTNKYLRKHYSIRSIGSTRRDRLDKYLARRLEHHPMVDPRVQRCLKQFQIYCPDVDLSAPRMTSHGLFWYNLHIVLVHDGRYHQVNIEPLRSVHKMILATSAKKQHLLSRASILSDHIHLTLGCHLDESPEEVALSYMNNLAYAVGNRPIFRFSYYVGTFSEYDLGAIPRL